MAQGLRLKGLKPNVSPEALSPEALSSRHPHREWCASIRRHRGAWTEPDFVAARREHRSGSGGAANRRALRRAAAAADDRADRGSRAGADADLGRVLLLRCRSDARDCRRADRFASTFTRQINRVEAERDRGASFDFCGSFGGR
jgi:hypothetical protein